MATKARHFEDKIALQRVLATKTVAEAKEVGKSIRKVNRTEWETLAPDKLLPGLKAKFVQNKDLLKGLLDMSGKKFVECSPVDFCWGGGFPLREVVAGSIPPLKGRNQMGLLMAKALTELEDEGYRIIQEPITDE